MRSLINQSRLQLLSTTRASAAVVLLIAHLCGLIGCSSVTAPAATSTVSDVTAAGTTGLSVALYPYVPRPDQFQTVLNAAWTEAEPNVELTFVDWDCYSSDPPPDLDVFVFDAIYLDYFQSQGFLTPIATSEIHNPGDFLPYALAGSEINGRHYTIPQLGCANILFYRQGDQALAAATTLSDVVATLGECTYSGEVPPPGTGLLVDLAGGTTNSCLYLDATEDIYGTYTSAPPLPPTSAQIDSWPIQNLQQLVRMASVPQARYSGDNPYQRGVWFGEGKGRALIGFTESMSAMGDQGQATVAFKLMPLADRGVSLFYSDLIGINAQLANQPHKRQLAIKLANLMASTEVMIASFGPTPTADFPQYLMPTRRSVFEDLSRQYPLYGEMYRMVQTSDPHLFRIGPQSKPWLAEMKDSIRDAVYAAPSCP